MEEDGTRETSWETYAVRIKCEDFEVACIFLHASSESTLASMLDTSEPKTA